MKRFSLAILSIVFMVLIFPPVCQAAGNSRKAFETVQHAKARGFLDRMATGVVDYRKGADPKVLSEEKALEKQLLDQTVKTAYPKGRDTSPEPSEMPGQKLPEIFSRYTDLLLKIKLSNPSPPGPGAKFPAPYLIRREIPKDGILLEYYLGRESSNLFVLTRKNFWSIKLSASREQVQKMVKAYNRDVRKGAAMEVITARGRDLSGQLGLDRLNLELSEKRLVIIAPHGALHRLPFHTLTLPRGGLLIENHRVVIVPSATAYHQMKYRAAHKTLSGKRALFCMETAPDNPPPGYQSPFRFFEIHLKPAKSYVNDDFTRDAFQKAATGAAILHLEDPYSYVSLRFPKFSQVFTGGEPLYFFNVEDTLFTGRLGVLSFPGSALGFISYGDDVESFARAFLISGLDQVIADLDSSSPTSARGFWREFYRVINNGGATSEAYQKAILESKKTDPARTWTRFVMMGVE